MKKGIHIRKLNHTIIQTDGSKIMVKLAMPVIKSAKVLGWSKTGISGLCLSLNQDSRSRRDTVVKT